MAESNNRAPYSFLRGLGWIKQRKAVNSPGFTWHPQEGAPGMSFDEALYAAGYKSRTDDELAHLTREHMETADKPCGYQTPPVGQSCRECGCKIGETKADDVIYVREEDRPPAERAHRQLVAVNRHMTALIHAFNASRPSITDFLESVKSTGQTAAEGDSSRLDPDIRVGTAVESAQRKLIAQINEATEVFGPDYCYTPNEDTLRTAGEIVYNLVRGLPLNIDS